jgi:hypothetical protein
MATTVHVESELPTHADDVWAALQLPGTMAYVCRGVLGFPAVATRSERFHQGERGTGWVRLFHVLPLHRHTIEVVELDEASRTVRTLERGGLLRSWRHTLQVVPIAAARCRYSDTVEIEAGALTPLVAGFTRVLFGYRHRRWQRLVRSGRVGSATS